MSRVVRAAAATLALLAAAASGACAHSATGAHVARDTTPRLEDAFDGEPALLVVIRPTKLARDPLYGPLVRRVTQLASTRVAAMVWMRVFGEEPPE